MKHALFILITLSFCFPVSTLAQVKAWEGTITIPTYPWEPDDLNPKFFALEDSIIYPYTMQDNLSQVKEPRVYKALFLENEYLKITCLPELGGRIHSVFNKINNTEMFHTNKVIKPGLIAMRGAWISGGIEWNTGPHGHTVHIVSPVDAFVEQNEDGSATLFVNNVEKIFRTRWTVVLTIHPGKTYLDERIRIYNPTDGVHPYYFWNCTAFPSLPGTRFIYPMTLGTDHFGENHFSWPIHKGKDISYLKNYDRPTSVFAYDCEFDFFGAYDVDLDQGIVSYANHHTVKGKKAWTWGTSGDGIVSMKNLHEYDERYIEVQSGPLLTQADYGLLDPHQEVAWQEWWYPVHGLGEGFEYATKDIAVQTSRNNGNLELRLLSTGIFEDAQCRIHPRGMEAAVSTIQLNPAQPTILTIADTGQKPVEITILDQQGDILLDYTNPLHIPHVDPPESPWYKSKPDQELSTEEIFLKGLLADKQTDRVTARERYNEVVENDLKHSEANLRLAILDQEAGNDKDALYHLAFALERDPDLTMAWYHKGIAHLHLHELEEAVDCGFNVIKFDPDSSLGYDLIGRCKILQNKLEEAITFFYRGWKRAPNDSTTFNHLMTARWLHDPDAMIPSEEIITYDPTDLTLQALAFLREGNTQRFIEHIENTIGEIEFEMLETTCFFIDLNLWRQAYGILKILDTPTFKDDRSSITYYYLSYLANHISPTEQSSKEYAKRAEMMPSDYVFPSRVLSIDVLNHAITINPKDANAHLLLGNLYGGLGRLQEATSHWNQAVRLNPSLSVAQRNLGLYAWKAQSNLDKATQLYKNAINVRPSDQTLYRDLSRILLQNNQREEAVAFLEDMELKSMRTDIIEILAQAYVDEKEYTKAIELLSNAFFSNWENRTMSRNVYVRAHIERGKLRLDANQPREALEDFNAALEYPVHLGVGRPANPEESEAYFWKGKAHQALSQTSEARSAWQRGADGHSGSSIQNQYKTKCLQALQK